VDARACYTAMASAHMLGLDASRAARDAGMVNFLRRCQARSLHTRTGGHPGTRQLHSNLPAVEPSRAFHAVLEPYCTVKLALIFRSLSCITSTQSSNGCYS
jgi:hypothetical protein